MQNHNPKSKSSSSYDNDDDQDNKREDTLLKKILTTGISAAFMTEESIRSFVSDLRLPKDSLQALLQSAAKSKEEVVNRVSREIIHIISKIDFVKEASRFVEDHKFRITAEIDVIRKNNTSNNSNNNNNNSESEKGTASS